MSHYTKIYMGVFFALSLILISNLHADTKPQIRVFSSSSTHDGDLGGIPGADMICQNLADAAGLPGDYKAWVSDGMTGPLDNFTPAALNGPHYVMVGDEKVFITKGAGGGNPDLLDGTLGAPGITFDENGVETLHPLDGLLVVDVWTGVNADGTPASEPNCDGWTSSSPQDTGLVGFGESFDVSPLWTNASGEEGGIDNCHKTGAVPNHIYCFEQ